MKELGIKYGIISAAIVLAAWLLGSAYMYKYKSQDTIVVTGLGETSFTSDLIVWEGSISVEASDKLSGYAQVEKNKKRVLSYLQSRGIDDSSISFRFVNVERLTTSVYNNEGNYMGSRYTGMYQLTQRFVVESKDVATVEAVSREISSLIAEGIDIEAYYPSYYYTQLDNVKQELIEKASADAQARARNIASNAGARLGKVRSAKLGVFQITGNNSDEDYSYGGTFNTSSRDKVGRITVRVEYRVK